ncbi:hypothetical protein BDV18DRAFT_136688 [Aspergillus unguis]
MSNLTNTKAWTTGKKHFDKAWSALDKLGTPVNRLSNRLGSEAFWPMELDKESDKCARILRSFCKDGVYIETPPPEGSTPTDKQKTKKEFTNTPTGKAKVLQKIPTQVLKQAKGIAIFTAMRTGLWVSGAGGSGILIAKNQTTGQWSAPSGLLLHTAGVGFLAGADIYDCVMVINTWEALEAFTHVRVTLGSEVSVAAGPVGVGGMLESEVHKRRAPIWTYVKSRGLYAGMQIDGTVVVERTDENERFYGRKVSAQEILGGKVSTGSRQVAGLVQTLNAAQGDKPFEAADVPGPSPYPSDLASSYPPTAQPGAAQEYYSGGFSNPQQGEFGQTSHPGLGPYPGHQGHPPGPGIN